MITYRYVARNPATGEKIQSEVQADNKKNASLLIQKLGYAPIEINEKETSKSGIAKFTQRVKAKDKIIFSRQLSTLINAGIPLVQSLRTVQDQTKNKSLQSIISRIVTDVESGKPLSTSLASHPSVFNTIYISLVAAGETSGTLDKSLERLSNQQEKDAEIISKVRGAMVYPVIILLVMLAVVTFMLVKVLPEVEKLYTSMKGAQLPLITRVLLAVSSVTVKYWWVVAIVVGIIILFTSKWARTLTGKKAIDSIKLKLPPTNQLMKRLYMARFSRTAHTLVASGVPLLQVLEVTARSINNVVIEQSLKSVMEKVRGGKALSDSLAADPYILDLVPKMIKIGEQSGSLEKMLDRTAEYYEKEVDNQVKTISTIVEPVMMVLLGGVALIIVAAVLLPIYGLAGQSVLGG